MMKRWGLCLILSCACLSIGGSSSFGANEPACEARLSFGVSVPEQHRSKLSPGLQLVLSRLPPLAKLPLKASLTEASARQELMGLVQSLGARREEMRWEGDVLYVLGRSDLIQALAAHSKIKSLEVASPSASGSARPLPAQTQPAMSKLTAEAKAQVSEAQFELHEFVIQPRQGTQLADALAAVSNWAEAFSPEFRLLYADSRKWVIRTRSRSDLEIFASQAWVKNVGLGAMLKATPLSEQIDTHALGLMLSRAIQGREPWELVGGDRLRTVNAQIQESFRGLAYPWKISFGAESQDGSEIVFQARAYFAELMGFTEAVLVVRGVVEPGPSGTGKPGRVRITSVQYRKFR